MKQERKCKVKIKFIDFILQFVEKSKVLSAEINRFALNLRCVFFVFERMRGRISIKLIFLETIRQVTSHRHEIYISKNMFSFSFYLIKVPK